MHSFRRRLNNQITNQNEERERRYSIKSVELPCLTALKKKLTFISDKEKSFTKEEAIDLMASLSATDANSEKMERGFYNSLSQRELQGEWDENWKT